VAVAAPRAEEEVAATAAPAAGDVEMTKEKAADGTEAAPAAGKPGEKVPAKGDAKAAAPAGDKKAEAKPEAKKK
jgi:hypothetical protein